MKKTRHTYENDGKFVSLYEKDEKSSQFNIHRYVRTMKNSYRHMRTMNKSVTISDTPLCDSDEKFVSVYEMVEKNNTV